MLGPDAVDVATGWFIDVTVALLNNHDSLWQSGEVGRSLRIPLRTRFITALIRLLSRPLSWFRERTPLDPELYAAVERIASGPGSPLLVVDRVIDLGAWVVQHREQTLALVDLVSAACDEVEYFQNLQRRREQAGLRPQPRPGGVEHRRTGPLQPGLHAGRCVHEPAHRLHRGDEQQAREIRPSRLTRSADG